MSGPFGASSGAQMIEETWCRQGLRARVLQVKQALLRDPSPWSRKEAGLGARVEEANQAGDLVTSIQVPHTQQDPTWRLDVTASRLLGS